jgi:biopolymer transport protein ExbB
VRRVHISIADLEDYAADLVNVAQRNGFRAVTSAHRAEVLT